MPRMTGDSLVQARPSGVCQVCLDARRLAQGLACHAHGSHSNPTLDAGAPPQLMSVPTHYFKVVLGEVKPQFGGAAKTAVGAFVM